METKELTADWLIEKLQQAEPHNSIVFSTSHFVNNYSEGFKGCIRVAKQMIAAEKQGLRVSVPELTTPSE